MRIISNFKDYYDSALSFGSDPSLNYLRKKEEFEFEARFTEMKNRMPGQLDLALRTPLEIVRRLPHRIEDRKRFTTQLLEIPVTAKVIGFCGFLHAAIEMDGTTYYATDEITSRLSSEFLQQCGVDRDRLEDLLLKESPTCWQNWYAWHRLPLTHEFWKRSVADLSGKRFDEVFVGLGVPAFKVDYVAVNKRGIHDTIRCTLNPYLRAESFQKIKSPAEAFQEISMYLGNQLARQAEPGSNIPDTVMRDEKGFDEWSFRRHKEESKKYRNKKSTD